MEPRSMKREVVTEFVSYKSDWTETSAATSESDDDGELDEEERSSNEKAFAGLKNDDEWGAFFRREPYDLEIGQKIGEGGQAKIFEAFGTNKRECVHDWEGNRTRLVVKVFKKGFRLDQFRLSWPPNLASAAIHYLYFPRASDGCETYQLPAATLSNAPKSGLCFAVGAQLMKDGRFAFVFDRFWGDLRKLMDKRILKSNGAPPFSFIETRNIVRNIALGMARLHKLGLVHKDLKASNVLVEREDIGSRRGYTAYIADFESSVNIRGTGFWRAPEVLLALRASKDKGLMASVVTKESDGYTSAMASVVAKASDVYSYAMTCYEVLTGRRPLADRSPADYDFVLNGGRPELPDDIDPAFRDMVTKCWHQDPLQRPSFAEIVETLGPIV